MSTKNEKITIDADSANQLFNVTSKLADLLEHLIESRGNYRDEFKKGLKKSISEMRAGKLKKYV